MENTNQKILIINDDELICLVISHTVQQFNPAIAITVKENGKTALKYLCETLSDNQKKNPNVILLDISMPEMDGFTFLEGFSRLNKNLKDISVYILSATIDEQVLQAAAKFNFVKGIYDLPLTHEKLISVFKNSAANVNARRKIPFPEYSLL